MENVGPLLKSVIFCDLDRGIAKNYQSTDINGWKRQRLPTY